MYTDHRLCLSLFFSFSVCLSLSLSLFICVPKLTYDSQPDLVFLLWLCKACQFFKIVWFFSVVMYTTQRIVKRLMKSWKVARIIFGDPSTSCRHDQPLVPYVPGELGDNCMSIWNVLLPFMEVLGPFTLHFKRRCSVAPCAAEICFNQTFPAVMVYKVGMDANNPEYSHAVPRMSAIVRHAIRRERADVGQQCLRTWGQASVPMVGLKYVQTVIIGTITPTTRCQVSN
jgi:hypothetical protein